MTLDKLLETIEARYPGAAWHAQQKDPLGFCGYILTQSNDRVASVYKGRRWGGIMCDWELRAVN